jgi:NAD(P)-dependent dehydrogenase (short-subunit alcohol dehydrogenase family)
VVAPVPLGRYGTAEDIASLHLFLASDQSAWLTGAEISIDGVSTAGHRPGPRPRRFPSRGGS